MGILGLFLTSDVEAFKDRPTTYRDWIYNDDSDSTGGNLSSLQKTGNEITIECIFTDDPTWVFECTKEQLAYILDRWYELTAWKVQEIVITRNGDTFTVEGHGFHD